MPVNPLAAGLEKERIEPLLLCDPDGTVIDEAIPYLLQHAGANHGMTAETEVFLFEAHRSQPMREKIQPALAQDKWVICDRFFDSTTVYRGAGRNLDSKLDSNAPRSRG